MALTIVEDTRAITGGVDTHADIHVAAALDPIGGLLGVGPVTPAGYARLLGWLGGLRDRRPGRDRGDRQLRRGPWPGTSPRLASGSWRVDRSDRQDRRRQGQVDPLDAVSAARRSPVRAGPAARPRAGTGRSRRSGR